MADLDRRSQGLGQRPALVLVDVINGFTDPACPLGSTADTVVAACETLLQAFRGKGLPVFYTTVVYHDERQARVFRDRLPALDVLVPGSHWVQVDPRVAPREGEIVVEKQWASGFFKTSLDTCLTDAGADSLVITGLTTSGCVRATAVDGLQNNYPVVIPREGVGDRNELAHEANLFDLNAKYADVTSLENVLKHVRELPSG
ncbi:MAG: isochorismatase family protein [Xanthomonadales bacterium]|jgi:nicotinamidase-related amidase|nr:isochorismatase family protein [Xanthomonadales bacterium]